jgi:hypothetical protein
MPSPARGEGTFICAAQPMNPFPRRCDNRSENPSAVNRFGNFKRGTRQ